MIRTVLDERVAGFTWIDIVFPTPEELQEVARRFGLHETMVVDCLQPDHLPKFERIDDITFLIVRHYDREAGAEADTVQKLTRKIAAFSAPSFLVTIHRIDHAFFTALRDRWAAATPAGGRRILYDIVGAALSTYEQQIFAAFPVVEDFESQIFSGAAVADIMQRVFIMKRRTSVFSRMIHLTVDVIADLEQTPDSDAPYLQDVRDTANRLYFYAAQLQENVNNLLSLQISLSALRTNEVMRVLTLFSVFFLPLTFVAGVYGMNFIHMPELKQPYGYPVVIGFMLLVSLGIFIVFKRKKWL